MLAAEDIRLVEETARDLYALGQADRAKAIEAVLAAATSALVGQAPIASRDYITTHEAARALAVPYRTVRGWVDRGELVAVRVGNRELVSREGLLAFLDRLRGARPRGEAAPSPTGAAGAQHDWLVASLPADKVARQAALHEQLEDEGRLSRAQRAELVALEREIADAAAVRLEEWISQAKATAT